MRTRRFLYVTAGDSHEECDGCDRTTRRQFLGQVQKPRVEHVTGLPAADGVTIDRDAQIILVRYQNRVFAFGLACPHENTALRWRQQDSRFQCPRHESKYQPDGTFISGRATRNMDRFAVRREGDSVVVDLKQWFRSDQQAAQWNGAALTL